jgi:MFS family permease
MGLLPDGDRPQTTTLTGGAPPLHGANVRDTSDITATDAMKTFVYWVITISMAARVAAHSTVIVHFVPILVWKGLTQEQAAWFLGGYAFLNLLTHSVLGWIADKMNKPRLMSICMLIPALSVLLLLTSDSLWTLWIFTLFFSALDASFPLSWATVGDFFGRKYFGTIRGTMSFFYMWGGAIGPVIAGAVYDRSETYASVIWGLIAILIAAAFLVSLLIQPWSNKMFAAERAPAGQVLP